jgi:hypothetical protein
VTGAEKGVGKFAEVRDTIIFFVCPVKGLLEGLIFVVCEIFCIYAVADDE